LLTFCVGAYVNASAAVLGQLAEFVRGIVVKKKTDWQTIKIPRPLAKRLGHAAIDRDVQMQELAAQAITAFLDAAEAAPSPFAELTLEESNTLQAVLAALRGDPKTTAAIRRALTKKKS